MACSQRRYVRYICIYYGCIVYKPGEETSLPSFAAKIFPSNPPSLAHDHRSKPHKGFTGTVAPDFEQLGFIFFFFKKMHDILAAFLSYLLVNAEETFSGSSYPYSPRCQTAVFEWQAAVSGIEDIEEIIPVLGFLSCYS